MNVPDRTPEALRRLHSLTGMLPLGAFLLEHLTVNALALGGPSAYRDAVAGIDRIPFLAGVEIVFIALPLVVHSAIGILIVTEQPARGTPEWPDRRAIVQRVTGLLILPYLLYHVWATRLSPDVTLKHADLFDVMSRQVETAGGLIFHALGVSLTAWHFGNGLRGFAARWGLARNGASERAVERFGLVLSVALAIGGVASLIAFARHAHSLPAAHALAAPVSR
jgi:succinate dehydrogenase / fumarate reductase cytochrome b subunit